MVMLSKVILQCCATIVGVMNVYATIMDAGGGPGPMMSHPTHILHQQKLIHQAHRNAKHFGNRFMPPFSSRNKFIPLPHMGVVSLPPNVSLIGPHLVSIHPAGLPLSPMGPNGQHGLIGIPPGSPVGFLKAKAWTQQKVVVKEVMMAAEAHRAVKFVPGPMLPPPHPIPIADPIHHLPMNHLFVHVPVGPGQVTGPFSKGM